MQCIIFGCEFEFSTINHVISSQIICWNRKPLFVEMEQFQLTKKYAGWKCCDKISHPNLPRKVSVMEWHHQWRWFFCVKSV